MAKTPKMAAEMAMQALIRSDSIATVFEVRDKTTDVVVALVEMARRMPDPSKDDEA